jgi:hypothetical protein
VYSVSGLLNEIYFKDFTAGQCCRSVDLVHKSVEFLRSRKVDVDFCVMDNFCG